jgi:hypothetical protein
MEERRSRHGRPGSAAADDRLRALGEDFDRLRVRARRQRRQGERIAQEPGAANAAAAAREWSATIDQILRIAETISREPAHDLVELAIKFEAAWWSIVEDDSLLDETARRWLLRFRRSLRHLAGKT